MTVVWIRPLHAELLYHVLGHLDLGRDAASLHRPGRPACPWAAALHGTYCAAPGRLVAQILPLMTPNLSSMITLLRERSIPGLDDAAGRELRRALLSALDAELPDVRRRWHAASDAAEARAEALFAWMQPLLALLRRALYAEAGRDPPPLTLVDCDALAHDAGTHGRAHAFAGQQRVAVAFAAPREQVLIQILHEETHQVTDPAVRERFGDVAQETEHDAPGYHLHLALERAAVEAGQRLLEQHAPELVGPYAGWRRRHGV